MRVKAWTAACVAALTMAGAADAEVLFSSIPDLYSAPQGVWNITSPTAVASKFTLTSAETINGFEFVDNSTAAWVPMYVFADNNGSPGEVLFGGGLDPKYEWSINTAHDTRIVGGLIPFRITLSAGTYWFGLSSIDGTTVPVERFSGSDPTVLCSQFGKFCTPDSATIGFSVIGYSPGSAVPEPTTWAMMLFGVALMGAALRRRPALSATNGLARWS